ncbi:cobyrinate a,c-diamide synthase [Micromonospora polyrhachis]|uniref:Cobyrinic acid a,c-diamide synthase n=1 Tax=Micromonospora polyrhachis TaxID=1282883 RepID=A0A7W7SVQ7_9ACTN|nr:cobyrinate a,c-diamide synthase [Micromonospora polyrhachis]MBB4960510.1 cobyrinic acid a,c-diamide synthase [Micromonospora polyrhachis]
MTAVPRLAVSAPSSGHGKTAVAVGLLAAYAARGMTTAGFKVGPDQTDAAYLGLAAGRPGRNLDPRLVGAQRIAPLFVHGAANADLAVVEGTMGLFDSVVEQPEVDSTAAICAALRTPVVLVVDVAAMGQSVAALVHGFRAYDELVWLGGVILNRVASDRHEQLLREALDDIGVPVFGVLRRPDLSRALPAREHGIVPVAHGSVEAYRGVRRLGEAIAEAVDLDRLLSLARSAPRLPGEAWAPDPPWASEQPPWASEQPPWASEQPPWASEQPPWAPDPNVRVAPVVPGGGPVTPVALPGVGVPRPVVAVAGSPTVTYSYPETVELLVAAGAEVRVVDPLRDETLPAGVAALVVGGGLPESYAEELAANRRLCGAVSDFARSGRPVLAEGAGALWLAREFDGRPMCGVLDASGTSTAHLVAGYREATARANTPVARLGTRVVGYKHHSAVLQPRAGHTPAWTWSGGAPEGFVWRGVHASQLILHWVGVPGIAHRLVTSAARIPDARPFRPGADPGTVVPLSPAVPAFSVVPADPAAVPVVVVDPVGQVRA